MPRIPEQPRHIPQLRSHFDRRPQKIRPQLDYDLVIVAPQSIIEIQMRHIPADKDKVIMRIGRNMPSNMSDSRIRFYIYELNFRMIMPKERIPKPRREDLIRFPRIKADFL
jgi:hypothetical protein